MKVLYVAEDGSKFYDKEICSEYERKINERKEEKKKLIAEKNARKEQILGLINQYMKDYDEPIVRIY